MSQVNHLVFPNKTTLYHNLDPPGFNAYLSPPRQKLPEEYLL
jgi:hypothetical protein